MARRVKFVPHYSKSDESWFVSIPPSLSKTGKRARLFFKNRAEALRASRRLKERHAKFGVSLSNLDPVRLGEASEAYKLLDAQNRPYSLLSIVREVNIQRTAQQTRSKSTPDVFWEYIESKGYLSQIHKDQIRTIAKKFGDSPISDVESSHLEQLLSPLSDGSRNRYLSLWNLAQS